MSTSIRTQALLCALLGAASLLGFSLNTTASYAQAITPPAAQTSAKTTGHSPGQIPTPAIKPPVARQIEPMVAPIRRVAPKQIAAPAATLPALVVSTGLRPSPASSAAVVAKPPAPQALLQTPAGRQKIVVHTCKIGQDYSEKLKSCVTPGVTSRVATAVRSARNKLGSSIESVTRSALGAKRRN